MKKKYDIDDEFLDSTTYKTIKKASNYIKKEIGSIGNEVNSIFNDLNGGHQNKNYQQNHPYDRQGSNPPPVNPPPVNPPPVNPPPVNPPPYSNQNRGYNPSGGERVVTSWDGNNRGNRNNNNNRNNRNKKHDFDYKKTKKKFVYRDLQVFFCIAFPLFLTDFLSYFFYTDSILALAIAGASVFGIKYLFDFLNSLYYKMTSEKDRKLKYDITEHKHIFGGLKLFSCIAAPAVILVLFSDLFLNSFATPMLAGSSIFFFKRFFDYLNFKHYKAKGLPGAIPEPEEEVKEEPKKTGISELDKVIEEGNEYIKQLRFADDVIDHEGISDCIKRMEKAAKNIFDFVKSHPEKVPQIKKFMKYYLPTTLKLLTSYQKLNNQSSKGENIQSTMFEIEAMMHTIADAFEKQLDSLFSQEALDIQTDITVLESILEQEGLKSDDDSTINLTL